MRFLFFLTTIFSFTSLAAPQDRFIRNDHLDKNISVCVNDGGAVSCPIVITGSTSVPTITNATLTNPTLTNATISSVNGNLIVATGDVAIGTASLAGENLLVEDASQVVVKYTQTTNSITFSQVINNTDGVNLKTTTAHNIQLGSNNIRRLLIDPDGNMHYRSAPANHTQDFGHIPFTVTGASSWTSATSTGSAGNPFVTMMIGPEDGSTTGTSSFVMDTGFIPGSFMFEVDATDFDFTISHGTGSTTFVQDFEIDSSTGETALKLRDDGDGTGCQGMTGNNACSGAYTMTEFSELGGTCSGSGDDFTISNDVGYFRIGDKVHVAGYGTITATHNCQAGNTVTLSLPIISSNFNALREGGGFLICRSGNANASVATISPKVGAQTVTVTFDGDQCLSNNPFTFEFTYEIP